MNNDTTNYTDIAVSADELMALRRALDELLTIQRRHKRYRLDAGLARKITAAEQALKRFANRAGAVGHW